MRSAEQEAQVREHLRATSVTMLLDDPSWVHRRVEQISFLDHETVRRRVSVDFELPDSLARPPELEGVIWYVPLTLQRKERPLVDFDLIDEEGRALPLITRDEAQVLAATALILTAGTVLANVGRELNDELAEELEALVKCEAGGAEQLLSQVLDPGNGLDRYHLSRDLLTTRLAKDLSQYFLLLTPIPDPSQRRVIKFSFREKVVLRDHGLARILGWKPPSFTFITSGVSQARSYHCEVSAPENLEILAAEMLTRGSPDEDPVLASSTAPTTLGESGQTPNERIHLQFPDPRYGDEEPVAGEGALEVTLRASRPGLPGASAMLGLGVALLLTAGVVFHNRVAGHSESATGLLVAVPALIGAYIARPEHQLAKRLLRGVSRLAGAVGALAFIAAASTILADADAGKSGGDEVVLITWTTLAALAWLATAVLALSYVLPLVKRHAPD